VICGNYINNYKIGECTDNVALSSEEPYKVEYHYLSELEKRSWNIYNYDCKTYSNNYTYNDQRSSNILTILDTIYGFYCIKLACKDSSGNIAEFYSKEPFFSYGRFIIPNITLPKVYRNIDYNFFETQKNFDGIFYTNDRLPDGLKMYSNFYIYGMPKETGTFKFVLYANETDQTGKASITPVGKEFSLTVGSSDQFLDDGSAYVHTMPNSFIELKRYTNVNFVPIYLVPKDLQGSINPQWKEKIKATMERAKAFHEKQYNGQSEITYTDPEIAIVNNSYDINNDPYFYPFKAYISDEMKSKISKDDITLFFFVKNFAPSKSTSFFNNRNNEIAITWPYFEMIDTGYENFADIVVAHELEHTSGIKDLSDRSLLGTAASYSSKMPDLFPLSKGVYINSLDLIRLGVKGLYPLKIRDVGLLDSRNNVITSVTNLKSRDKILIEGSGFTQDAGVDLVYRDTNSNPKRISMQILSHNDYQITAIVPDNVVSNFAFIEVILPNGQVHLYDNQVSIASPTIVGVN